MPSQVLDNHFAEFRLFRSFGRNVAGPAGTTTAVKDKDTCDDVTSVKGNNSGDSTEKKVLRLTKLGQPL